MLASNPQAYRELGRLVADMTDLEATTNAYITGLMKALSIPASRGGHANTLAHLQGFVKESIGSKARQELADTIERYRKGELPLLAPVTLLKHHLQTHESAYALAQVYLDPHPAAVALRRDL